MTHKSIPPKSVLYAARLASLMRIAETSQALEFVAKLAEETAKAEQETSPRKRRRSARQWQDFSKGVGALAAELVRTLEMRRHGDTATARKTGGSLPGPPYPAVPLPVSQTYGNTWAS